VKAVEGIILSKEQRGNFENRVRCKDRGVVDFAWSAHWSAQDQTLFCVARDISERKMIDRLKRDFVAMVSHDLRTPLTSIQMLLSLLEAEAYGPLNENGRENVAAAEASVERLIGLVNGLLDLEKMESGKLDLLRESWHVGDVLEPSLQAVRGFAFQQGVSVVVPVHADIEIFADRDRLVQVLINLISNAIKFSPRGGTVDLTVAEEPRWVTFGVKDQGRGVPPEMREAIFDRFKQVEHDDARVKGGSGLGLAICKAIVERHGGLIGVDSVEGKGSNFWFKLPRQPGAL
jgi:signal transduction histidine kinase